MFYLKFLVKNKTKLQQLEIQIQIDNLQLTFYYKNDEIHLFLTNKD